MLDRELNEYCRSLSGWTKIRSDRFNTVAKWPPQQAMERRLPRILRRPHVVVSIGCLVAARRRHFQTSKSRYLSQLSAHICLNMCSNCELSIVLGPTIMAEAVDPLAVSLVVEASPMRSMLVWTTLALIGSRCACMCCSAECGMGTDDHVNLKIYAAHGDLIGEWTTPTYAHAGGDPGHISVHSCNSSAPLCADMGQNPHVQRSQPAHSPDWAIGLHVVELIEALQRQCSSFGRRTRCSQRHLLVVRYLRSADGPVQVITLATLPSHPAGAAGISLRPAQQRSCIGCSTSACPALHSATKARCFGGHWSDGSSLFGSASIHHLQSVSAKHVRERWSSAATLMDTKPRLAIVCPGPGTIRPSQQ